MKYLLSSRVTTLVASLATITSLMFYTSSMATELVPVGKDKIVDVTFTHPLTLDELKLFAEKGSINVAMLRSEFNIGGVTHQEFYVLQPSAKNSGIDTEILQRDFRNNRLSLIHAVIDSYNNLQNDKLDSRQSMVNAMSNALNTMDVGTVLISKAIILTNQTEIGRLTGLDIVQGIEVGDTAQHQEKLNRKSEVMKQQTIDAQANVGIQSSSWWPNEGYSFTGANTSTERYTLQYMGWYTPAFTSEETYEHDFFLNNYDNATYLDSDSTAYPGCYPATTYAVTTWPASSFPYLDTRFDITNCEYSELPFTIGAAQANAIPGGVWHYNYITTANGNASSDSFKLQAQRGERFPSGCYTTWCSFSNFITDLEPAWNSAVPGSVYWTK